MVTEEVRRLVAVVFDCAVADVEPDQGLDDLGLDSMMAMEFRVRINGVFGIDLPVLEANAQELGLHEEVLGQIDKSSGGKTVWKKSLENAI